MVENYIVLLRIFTCTSKIVRKRKANKSIIFTQNASKVLTKTMIITTVRNWFLCVRKCWTLNIEGPGVGQYIK